MLVIEVSFKTLINVIDVFHALPHQQVTSLLGALATAADENDRGTSLFRVTDDTPQHKFSDLGEEVRINSPVRLVYPRDVYCTFGVPDKKILHRGANIDKYRARIILHHLPCLFRGKAMEISISHSEPSISITKLYRFYRG